MNRSLSLSCALLLLLLLPGCADTAGDFTVPDDDDSAADDDDDSTADDDDDSTADDDDDTSADDDDDTAPSGSDLDGDGYSSKTDCNDNDAAINPAADELCDGTDHNCDGDSLLDAIDAPTWYQDTDGDGYGTESDTLESCFQPHGYSSYSGDCNDTDPSYHPGAAETDCTDDNDYNCDQSTGFADVDGDSHAACEDCDDTNPAVHPAAIESCNNTDDDCDGVVDEDGATGESTWYLDADGDSYGRSNWTETSCQQPTGFADNGDDCDDLDGTSYPGAPEACDGADNDCDNDADEGVTTTFYGDADGDGYGDPGSPTNACFLPPGASVNDDDCDDGEASVHPGGIELCDSLDNDCDSVVDEYALDASTWYADSDLDGYGDPLTGATSCSPIAGAVENGLDCDDGDSDNYPGNTESCDGADENCNSQIDEGFDGDNDGVSLCGADGTTGTADDDCNDADPGLFPGNPELCDALDQDCDAIADNGLDLDTDSITPCGADGISGTADDDCDDSDQDNFPGNTEICDAQDNNCDTSIDETFDSDGDNFTTCGSDGFTGTADDDCDDNDNDAFPGNVETCDGHDQDCNGIVDNGYDSDGDGLTTCGADGIPGTGDEDCDDSVSGQALNGTNETCGAVSCKLISDNYPSSTSGPYWIDPESDGNSFQVYCDMDNHGGGWTLVLMTASNDPTTFEYDSQYWDSTALINETVTDPTTDDNMKNEAYNSLPFIEVRLDMSTQGNSHILASTQNSALTLFNGPQLGITGFNRNNFLDWIDVSNSNWNNQPNCNAIGFNLSVDGGEARCRYGITMNNENDCNTNDSAIGFGCFTQFTNVPVRNIACGGFRWSTDTRYNRRGWIYVR
jgi:large repetitive protein